MDKVYKIETRLDQTGKMKRVAGADKNPQIVRIPDIARISPIAVEPQLRIIALHVEHVQLAIGIKNV